MNERKAVEVIRRNMQKLSEKEREALEMVCIEEKTIYGTAKELKISRSTVRYRVKMAKMHLKEKITEEIGKKGIEEILKG